VSRYEFSAKAKLDLVRIIDRIAIGNADAAKRLKNDIVETIERAVRMPGIGHFRSDVRNPDYKFLSVFPFVIAYRPASKPLKIVRILHGAQNIEKIFRKR
jgi:toxin ParE1/3/4